MLTSGLDRGIIRDQRQGKDIGDPMERCAEVQRKMSKASLNCSWNWE